VSEGGNGHWYGLQQHVGPIEFAALESMVESQLGARLVTIPSQAEDHFVWEALGHPQYAVLGGYQSLTAADYSERRGGWYWVSGESITQFRWTFNEPSNGGGWEHVLAYNYNQSWNDWQTNNLPSGSTFRYIVEWDADCNGDGLVDYGQILRGDVADLNGNGVPDICELSVTSVVPVSGPTAGGTPLTINGNNFPANPVVTLGGVAATDVVRHSATRITAMTPTNLPGTVDVTVNSWTSPDAFYYRPFCGSDLDNSGSVDAGDIAIILLDFGPCYPTETPVAADSALPFLLQDEAAPNSRAR